MEAKKKKRGNRDAWKAKGGGAEDAVVEGVADHQTQRPFSSLKESLLMVQRSPLTPLFFLPCGGVEWWLLCSYDFTYRGGSLDLAKGK